MDVIFVDFIGISCVWPSMADSWSGFLWLLCMCGFLGFSLCGLEWVFVRVD